MYLYFYHLTNFTERRKKNGKKMEKIVQIVAKASLLKYCSSWIWSQFPM